MASLKAENAGSAEEVTSHLSEETKEISPTVEGSVLSPDDQDIVTPPTEPETEEKFVSVENEEEEKEKKAYELEEEEDDPEAARLTEEAAPDHSTKEAPRAIHEFTGEEEEDDDEDDED